jgi:CRP-like cAMP-binding protein
MHKPHCPGQNQLLAGFPEQELARLWKHFDPVFLAKGEVLRQAGRGVQHVYFPTEAVVSWQYMVESGASAEFAVVGSDGMVGIESLLSDGTSAHSAVVIASGQAMRIRDDLLREAFERDTDVRSLMLRYAQALITQIGQTAVCNRHHNLDQQTFRSLLDSLDRSDSGELAITHELLASRMGVRREGVSGTAYKARKERLINYRRGHVTILDRAGVEARACECYGTVKRECARLLPRQLYAPWCDSQDCASCAAPLDLATGLRSRRYRTAPNPLSVFEASLEDRREMV